MIKILSASALLAIAIAAPASAQILGGGGGLAGGLGGTLGSAGVGGFGGTMGGSGMGMLGSTIDRTSRDLPIAGDAGSSLRGSTRSERSIDTRKGHVRASNDSTLDSTVANSARIGNRAIGGNGSASGNASGSADAQLIGTDAVRSATGTAIRRTRDAASAVGDRTTAATSRLRDAADGTVGYARQGAGTALTRAGGTLAGTGNLAASATRSAGGTLALAGSTAANGQGAFPVSAGMPVTDGKGRLIGTVQSVRTAASGTVEQVLVRVKDKTAALPAANFTGSGTALVSAMGRGEVKKSAE